MTKLTKLSLVALAVAAVVVAVQFTGADTASAGYWGTYPAIGPTCVPGYWAWDSYGAYWVPGYCW